MLTRGNLSPSSNVIPQNVLGEHWRWGGVSIDFETALADSLGVIEFVHETCIMGGKTEYPSLHRGAAWITSLWDAPSLM